MVNSEDGYSKLDGSKPEPEDLLLTRAVVTNKKRRIIYPPAVGTMGTPAFEARGELFKEPDTNTVFMMGDNPALPKMPERPTLADFFRYRLHPRTIAHLLQSANLAPKAGLDEKVILASITRNVFGRSLSLP